MQSLKPVKLEKFNLKHHFIFLVLILFSKQLFADILAESFSTTTNKDTSTAIWNSELGVIHPTLSIDYQVTNGGPILNQSVMASTDDGSDGPFELATYANFGSVVGNLITIDASIRPVLKVSRFTLDSSYTLTSINGPLVIRSLTTIVINGTIQCSGNNGSAASGASGGAGGAGRCGGQSGAAGGNATANGTAGSAPAELPSGGGGGGTTGATGAGGGGGCSFTNGVSIAGTNASAAGGSAGTCVTDHDFINLKGSAGGGGGAGSTTEGGGGGGAGGGVVVIHAIGNITISATGLVLAKGGNGGSANTGGGGGGGGGGSIKILSPGTITLTGAIDPCADASNGVGPTPGASAGKGGNGSSGRTWLMAPTFTGASYELPVSVLWSTGTLKYATAAQNVVTKSLDTSNSSPTYTSITSDPVTSEVAFEVSGSNDNFASDNTGWLSSTSISSLNTKRYVKFRMTLTNTNATTPTQVTSVSLNYTPTASSTGTDVYKQDFQFKSGCGRISAEQNTNTSTKTVLYLMLLIPFFFGYYLRLKAVESNK